MRQLRSPSLLALSAAALLGACDQSPPWSARCPAGFTTMVRGEMFLGRNIGPTEAVSEEDLRGFLDTEVTPRFPDGFTVHDGAGQWRDVAAADIIRERAKVLVIVMRNDGDGRRRLQAVGEAYKARFKQQSVLMAMTPACAAF